MQRNILESILSVVRHYINILSRYIEIQEAYLFGSYVKGTWLKSSDIDLVIVSRDFKELKFLERLELLYGIQWRNNITPFIEVIPLTPEEFIERRDRSAVLRDAKKYWIRVI